jgi:hypothetical protein
VRIKRKPHWLQPRPGLTNSSIAVFKDDRNNQILWDKPVEVRVDGDAQIVYVWTKIPGYKVVSAEEFEKRSEIDIGPPWPGVD